jgi:hypothetical protein
VPEVDVKDDGPLQLYVSGPPLTGVAVTVTLPPAHIAPVLVSTVADGAAMTDTVPDAVALHPAALVAVTVYVPAVETEIEGVTSPVLQE